LRFKARQLLGPVGGVVAGVLWYALAGGGSVRLDVESELPDAYELFEYDDLNTYPFLEVLRPFELYSPVSFPVTSKLVHFRIDPGAHPGVVRIKRLCFEQGPLVRRCFDGAELVPHVRLGHDVTLIPDGHDLIVISKSTDPYINFLPTLHGYSGARIVTSIVIAICAFLLIAFPSLLPWVACAAAVFWSASNWGELVRLTRQTYTAAPLYDYWRIVASIPRYEHFDLSVLWEQHNDHRIIFPEIAMAADSLLFHGRGFLPLGLLFAFQLLTVAIYAWMFRSAADKLSPSLRWFTILLVCGLAAWPGMALFFGHPFLVVWLFLQIGVVTALAALPRSIGISIAGGVVATYSVGSGMLIWPILVLAAIALNLSRRRIAILAISGALFTGLYFAGYHPSTNLHPKLLFEQPVFALKWIAAYLSLPFGYVGAQTGLWSGFTGLGLLLALAIACSRKPRPASVLFLGAALFVAASAVMAAAGRMAPDRVIPSTELDVRFVAQPLWFWLSLLCAVAVTKWNWRIAAPVALLLAALTSATHSWIGSQLPAFQNNQLASLALETGVPDAALISQTLYYEPELVEQQADKLRKRELSVFANGRFQWLGQRAAAVFPRMDATPASGAVTSTTLVEGGMRITGWTTADWSNIVFVNENGLIAGFGDRMGAGWAGFANLEVPSKSLVAYRIVDGKMAAIGAPILLPDAVQITFSRMGQFLSGVPWLPDEAWKQFAVSPELGGGPYGVTYGTWNSNKKAQGRMVTAPFDAPPGNCVVITAGHGAPVTDQRIQVVDGATEAPIATLPISNADNIWRLWRVALPAGVRTLKIVAEDRSSDSKAWLGLGQPARCTSSY
jgi:hypothetical protein